MRIISTNIGGSREIDWNGKKITTGMYKEPVSEPLFLGMNGVHNDHVSDLKHHGGSDKACYIYSADHYDYWKNIFPDLDWTWGMFGENLTIEELDEGLVRIGDIFQVGNAQVQVSQPRLPCYKLGIRLQSNMAVKQFLNSPYPGVYIRVIKEGTVKAGDTLELIKTNKTSLSVRAVFSLFSSNKLNIEMKELALQDDHLAKSIKNDLIKNDR